jgi:cytoskeletal protein CcmA (bactofilin family)
MGVKSKENGHNHIATGTKIKGDIESKGDLRIDGHISGSIITEGKIVVGTEGYVEGNIKCRNADISGTVIADMDIAELIVLKETAKMNGNIITKKISIEPGAEFSGNCKMGDKNSPNDGKKQK